MDRSATFLLSACPATHSSEGHSFGLSAPGVTPARALVGMVTLSLGAFRRGARASHADVRPGRVRVQQGRSLDRRFGAAARPRWSAHFTALLEPLLTAPLWPIHDTNIACHAILDHVQAPPGHSQRDATVWHPNAKGLSGSSKARLNDGGLPVAALRSRNSNSRYLFQLDAISTPRWRRPLRARP